jgi:hypothetical protein
VSPPPADAAPRSRRPRRPCAAPCRRTARAPRVLEVHARQLDLGARGVDLGVGTLTRSRRSRARRPRADPGRAASSRAQGRAAPGTCCARLAARASAACSAAAKSPLSMRAITSPASRVSPRADPGTRAGPGSCRDRRLGARHHVAVGTDARARAVPPPRGLGGARGHHHAALARMTRRPTNTPAARPRRGSGRPGPKRAGRCAAPAGPGRCAARTDRAGWT